VLLIGDAAHAATPRKFALGLQTIRTQTHFSPLSWSDTGHGANMAMEDGEALGYILSDIGTVSTESPEQLDEAIQERFQKFMSIRVARSHYVQKAARLAGGISPPEEGRYNPQAFSQTMHPYAGAEAVLKSPSSQPSYDI
jgi:hypothetical protein